MADKFIACRSTEVFAEVSEKLLFEFEMKDFGKMKSYLGMDIGFNFKEGEFSLTQSHYVKKILRSLKWIRAKHFPYPWKQSW